MRSTWRLHVAFKVRTVYQALKVAAPAVLRVKGLPVRTDGGQDTLVPDDFPITEEVQVHRAPFQMDGVHGLRPARFNVNGLLFWSTGKFPACDHEALVSCILNELAHVQEESCLFLAQAHLLLLISASFSTVRPPKYAPIINMPQLPSRVT